MRLLLATLIVWLVLPVHAGHAGATGTMALHNPHDVDRMSNGHTLITDGGYTGGQQAGNDSKVLEVDSEGNVVWSFTSGLNFAHGAERLPNGHTLISATGHDRVIEVDSGGNVVWNSLKVTLSDGSTLKYPNEAHWLSPGNNLLITDRDNHRAIIIKRDGTVLWQFGQTGQSGDDATHLSGPHNADRLSNGNVIIADSGNDRILDVTPAGAISWEYCPTDANALNWPRDADRLASGNTLIVDSEHYRLIEVTPSKQVVWQYGDLELPYDADRLTNGNTLISKSLTGYVIEVNPAGAIVWSYPPGLVDVDIPSMDDPNKIWAVRIQAPVPGAARYDEGAPVIIWGPGGFEADDLKHDLPPDANDLIIVTVLFPGTTDQASGRTSGGSYDFRGRQCIQAIRDVVLYTAGKIRDVQGRLIDEVVPVPVLHDNVGLIGVSNGGNIIVAVPALHGTDLAVHLRYVIQWETPVSSQVATRDFGRIWMKPSAAQGDYFNPRYLGYGPLTFPADYNDLAYNASEIYYPVFHDGNKDGCYTLVEGSGPGARPSPDLNGNRKLELDEDFPLDAYLGEDGLKWVYSRPVTYALSERHIFTIWPAQVATPTEADAYWDIREAVRMYGAAMNQMTELEAMVLAGVRDHVQSAPDKPHIRQAFEGWRNAGAWVQINPSSAYLLEVSPNLNVGDLPNNEPNAAPTDWSAVNAYCIPEAIDKGIYQLAAIRQMADRAHSK